MTEADYKTVIFKRLKLSKIKTKMGGTSWKMAE